MLLRLPRLHVARPLDLNRPSTYVIITTRVEIDFHLEGGPGRHPIYIYFKFELS